MGASKWDGGFASLGGWRRSVVEGNLQEDDLDHHHDQGLDEQRDVEAGAGVVEYPGSGRGGQRGHWVQEFKRATDLHNDATSMMSGISSEKPALDRFRCIE